MQCRHPSVSGIFYPQAQGELKKMVGDFLAEIPSSANKPKALIVPHAGYIYSGSVAAKAYQRLRPFVDGIKRVALFGPSHRVAFEGLAVPEYSQFETPLGKINLDLGAIEELCRLPSVIRHDMPHEQEHSLEVQLPFLQWLLDDFALIPISVGSAKKEYVREVMAAVQDESTLLVASSDLSHYHNYQAARELDGETDQLIRTCHSDLNGDQACGAYVLNGLLQLAENRGWEVELLALQNSGDTAGDKQRVVGYGAYAVY